MLSQSQQKKREEVNRVRRLKDVIEQLKNLGIVVDEPTNIKRYDEYKEIMENERHLRSILNEEKKKAHKEKEEKSRKEKEENLRQREAFEKDPIRNRLKYSESNLEYLQNQLWKGSPRIEDSYRKKGSPRKKGQTRKRRHRPKTKKKVKKKIKKKIKKHTPKRTQKIKKKNI